MKKPASILILCMLLGLGLSAVIPAEDLPETAHDESESLPYVVTSAFSTTASETQRISASPEENHCSTR